MAVPVVHAPHIWSHRGPDQLLVHDISALTVLGWDFHTHLPEHDRGTWNLRIDDSWGSLRSLDVDVYKGVTDRDPRETYEQALRRTQSQGD